MKIPFVDHIRNEEVLDITKKIAVKSELVPQQQAIHQHIILHSDSFDSNSGVPLVSDNEG